MKDEFAAESSLKEALILAVQVLSKSMDVTSLDVNKYEVGVMHKDSEGKLVQRRVVGEELRLILEEAKVGDTGKGK